MITHIYALVDPRNGEVRYVGKTVLDPKLRLNHHLWSARNSYRKTYCVNWIKSLIREGLLPNVQILESVEGEEWAVREKYWIAYYNSGSLTNHSLGGEGGRLGYPHSEETKKRIGDAQRGRKGLSPSIETRQKMSTTLTGRQFTSEHRAKIAEANRNRTPSEGTRLKIAASLRRYNKERKNHE